jgi:hypothetical protein
LNAVVLIEASAMARPRQFITLVGCHQSYGRICSKQHFRIVRNPFQGIVLSFEQPMKINETQRNQSKAIKGNQTQSNEMQRNQMSVLRSFLHSFFGLDYPPFNNRTSRYKVGRSWAHAIVPKLVEPRLSAATVLCLNRRSSTSLLL